MNTPINDSYHRNKFNINSGLVITIIALLFLIAISIKASAKEGLNFFKLGPQCEDENYLNALVNCHGSEEFITIDDNELCRSSEFLRDLADETCNGAIGGPEGFARRQDCANDNYRIINPNSILAFMGLDRDGDTIRNECDNCPNDFNQEQLDFDGDLVGDVCELTSTFLETAYLKASNAGIGDYFGKSVAISGNTLVVGADEEDPNDEVGGRGNSGAAYVYEKNEAGVWEETAYLKASNAGVGDRFGKSIGISENTIVVGAHYEDEIAFNSGAAYVYERNAAGEWEETAYLKASNAGESDLFGVSISISENTIVVGAYLEDGIALNSGAAYVYERNAAGEWEETAYLKSSNAGIGDNFGVRVSTSGNTVVVGAYLEDGIANNSGAAYVYEKNAAGEWEETTYLKSSNAGIGDRFGKAVSTSENTIVVGAYLEDGRGRNSGAAYVYERSAAGEWEETAYLKASNAGIDDFFGASISTSGNTVVVGAHYEDGNEESGQNGNPVNEGARESGAAYIFEKNAAGQWEEINYLKSFNAGSGDYFGRSSAISEGKIVIGAYREDGDADSGQNGQPVNELAPAAGAVYVFER